MSLTRPPNRLTSRSFKSEVAPDVDYVKVRITSDGAAPVAVGAKQPFPLSGLCTGKPEVFWDCNQDHDLVPEDLLCDNIPQDQLDNLIYKEYSPEDTLGAAIITVSEVLACEIKWQKPQ